MHPANVFMTLYEEDGALWDMFSFDLRIPLSRNYANPGKVTVNFYNRNDATLGVNILLWEPKLDFDFSTVSYIVVHCRQIVPDDADIARAEIWILPGDPRPQAQANITVPIKRYQTEGSYILPFKGWWSTIDSIGLGKVDFRNPAELFAWDFAKRTEEGLLYKGKASELIDYAGYDQPVLACEDGKVAKTQSGYRDNKINEDNGGRTLADVWGNYVILDHGNGEYSFYAHLAPGSISVRSGQKVMRGMEIGKVGNSGLSSVPHLSFGFIDRPNLYKNPNANIKNFDPSNVTANSLPVTFTSIFWHEGGNKVVQVANPRPGWTVANVTPETISQTEGD